MAGRKGELILRESAGGRAGGRARGWQKLVLGWVSSRVPSQRAGGAQDEVCEAANPPPVSGTLGLQRGDPPGEGRGLLRGEAGALSGAGGLPFPPPDSHAALQKAAEVEMHVQGWDRLLGFSSSRSLGPRVVRGSAVAVSRQQVL